MTQPTLTCPHCAADVTTHVMHQLMSARGKAGTKASKRRTSEQCRAAVLVRWAKKSKITPDKATA